MVVGDDLGAKERSWVCAGYQWLAVEGLDEPVVLAPEGRGAVPVLMLPERWPERWRDLAFGWAWAEICELRCGWPATVRCLIGLREAVEVA